MARQSLQVMDTKDQQYISLEDLNEILQLDVYYRCATDSLISAIYDAQPTNPTFIRFRSTFTGLACSGHAQRHLIFIWCGLLELKYLRNGKFPQKPNLDVLDNWMRDIDIGEQDLKSFLRKNAWPLPVNIFCSEPDNTKNKVEKSSKIYRRYCYLQLEELPRLERRLRDLNNISPETMIKLKEKEQQQSELEKRIEIVKEGRDPDKKPARKEVRNHNMLMIALEYRKGTPPKSWRNISLILEKMDVAEGLKDGRIREILRETLRAEKMEGK